MTKNVGADINMNERETALEVIKSVEKWFFTLPTGVVKMSFTKNLEVNHGFYDGVFHFTPAEENAASLNIEVCGDAIGFTVSSVKAIAKLMNVKPMSNDQLVCLGTEPITRIDRALIIEICEAVSKGQIDIYVGISRRKLLGMYSSLQITSGPGYRHSTGRSSKLITLMSTLGLARMEPFKFKPWM